MTPTPEEFFVHCLMEQSPPSPSLCPDLPSLPDAYGEGWLFPNEMMLPHISRMLMEDDTEEKLSDDPALLRVQQPFAEILFDPSFGTDMGNNVNRRGNTEGPMDLMQDGSCYQMTAESAFAKGADAVGAFLRGMEEAKTFLPKYGSFREDDLVSQLFRESTNHGGPRTNNSKDDLLEAAVSMTDEPMTMTKEQAERVDASEMLDGMMWQGCEKFVRDMEKLRITMANEAEEDRRKDRSNTARVVVDLPTLLTHCAQAVAANNRASAWQLLNQIKQDASTTGNATQRLARCFAKGLEARLAGTGTQLYQFRMGEPPSTVEYLEAYQLYVSVCSFDKVALCFSAKTIVDTIVGKSKVHIVDYGLDYAFQLRWAGLLELLANREGGSPEVKITAINHPGHWFYPAEQMEETGSRLHKWAAELGLRYFKFHTIKKKWEDVCIQDLDTESNEVLIVNDHFNLSTLMDESVFFDDPCPRDAVLSNIAKMRPAVFIQNVVNCTYGTSFLSRFRGALFYYMALFDMLDATIPRESKQRVVLEQELFGGYAVNVIASEGVNVVQHPEKYTQWQARNQRAGLRQIPLKPYIVKEVASKIKKHHKDFLLSEDGHWLLQGWTGRVLFAHSTWVAQGTCQI